MACSLVAYNPQGLTNNIDYRIRVPGSADGLWTRCSASEQQQIDGFNVQVFSTDFSRGEKKLLPAGKPANAAERFQKLAWGGPLTGNSTMEVNLL